jgi:hypothetical protein
MMLMMFHSTWDGYLNRDSRLSARCKNITSWGNKKKHRVGRSYLRRWGVCWGPMGCFSIRERFVAGFRLLLLWQLYPQHRRLLDTILLILYYGFSRSRHKSHHEATIHATFTGGERLDPAAWAHTAPSSWEKWWLGAWGYLLTLGNLHGNGLVWK